MIELRRTHSRLTLSPTMWMLAIELAKICGWEPCGTCQQSEPADVDGGQHLRHLMAWQTEYLSSEGQTVTTADAVKLANALQRATTEAERILVDWTEGRSVPPRDIRNTPGGFRWFCTPAGKSHLQNIEGFCRVGAFQIF